MTVTSNLSPNQDEAIGHAAYVAFLLEVRSWLPHEASEWSELPMPLRQAWIKAALAARAQ
jgi:hypothetical protein